MTKERALEIIKQAFGDKVEDGSIKYHCAAYDGPIFFTPLGEDFTVQSGGVEFDVPYELFDGVVTYGDRSYLRVKTSGYKYMTYTIWR